METKPMNPLTRFACRPGRGQSMVEYAVLLAAVGAALVLASDYVRKAFNAHAKALQEELNGATEKKTN